MVKLSLGLCCGNDGHLSADHPGVLWHLQFTESHARLGTCVWCRHTRGVFISSSENRRNEKKNYKCRPAIMSSMTSHQCFEVNNESGLMTAEAELMLMRLGTKAGSVRWDSFLFFLKSKIICRPACYIILCSAIVSLLRLCLKLQDAGRWLCCHGDS